MEVLDGRYVRSVDGTGVFVSKHVKCDNCCRKHHRNGPVTRYHPMPGAVPVHPYCREVIPLMPKPVMKENDCEHNVSKRRTCLVLAKHSAALARGTPLENH